jgi:hypothetical protein
MEKQSGRVLQGGLRAAGGYAVILAIWLYVVVVSELSEPVFVVGKDVTKAEDVYRDT